MVTISLFWRRVNGDGTAGAAPITAEARSVPEDNPILIEQLTAARKDHDLHDRQQLLRRLFDPFPLVGGQINRPGRKAGGEREKEG